MAGMDKRSLSAAFQLLDSKDIQVVNDFVDNLKLYEKDSWVVESLIVYYMSTQSQKAADLIVKSHSDNDKVIFKKLHSTYEDLNTRKATVKLLLYIVSCKPPWLYKIVHEQLLKDVLRCMKLETNVPLLLDAIYVITMLLPVVPDGLVKFFDEIFEALLRIIHFSFHNKDGVAELCMLHLNVGVYALFSRLYGMYPWHYICALQELYSKNKLPPDFYKKAIEPMLSTVKFNPSLITASKEAEYRGDRWKTKAMHDIVAECASLSLDMTETTKDYQTRCPVIVSNEHDKVIESMMPHPTREKDSSSGSSTLVSSEELSAPIEMAKDSLISVAANSSTFFSPSDRLGLSTPPPGDPTTPSSTATNTNSFNFITPNSVTPHSNAGHTKTPQYTPKNTPTTPLVESGGALSRSRHTSGTKRSVSRISTEDSIPPSPLRKEFTSEPPTDIPKITSVGYDCPASTTTTTTLSVSNLPHLLEKISDTGSVHDTDTSNNSEDEEVESINTQPVDLQTAQSVVEFMKTVNRIRFISMTQAESEAEKMTRGGFGLRRSGSCPTFSEDMFEESQDSEKPCVERSASIQTTSSNDQLLSKESPPAATDQSALPTQPVSGISAVTHTTVSSTGPYTTTGIMCDVGHAVSGPGAILDKHILLLNEKLRLGSVAQSQLQAAPRDSAPSSINWSHFGGTPPTDEASIARVQLLLLHTQMLYERQKKELHAQRNRRLLSKIAKAEKIKENNQTLEWQLSRSKDDIFNLQTTIRLQNNEIHRMKEEKARNDTCREQEFSELAKENERLQSARDELQRDFTAMKEQLNHKQKDLAESIGKIELLEQDLQMAVVEIYQYKRYEDEVSRMKKELLLMGEIQIKYEEKLASLKYDNHLIAVNSALESDYLQEITKLKESVHRLTEECNAKQNTVGVLNNKLKDKERIIFEQQKQMQCLRGEHKCKLQAVEDKHSMAQSARQALEMHVISLYDRIGRLTVPEVEKPRTSPATHVTGARGATGSVTGPSGAPSSTGAVTAAD